MGRLIPVLLERIRSSESGSLDAPTQTLTHEERKLLESLGYIEPDSP